MAATAKDCDDLSRRVQTSSAVLAFFELVLVGAALSVRGTDLSTAEWMFWAGVFLTAIVWIVTQILNYRLVRCGPHRERYALAPRTINRPDFFIRTAFHLIINWSAIAAALIGGHIVGAEAATGYLGYACMVATVAAWTVFNALHRQANRRRNLILSTTIAVALVVAALVLVQRSG